MLSMTKGQFKEIYKEDFKTAYNTCVWTHLEYCIQAWSQRLHKNKACFEKPQRRATRLVMRFKKLPCECQVNLKTLEIYSLERRRLCGDLNSKKIDKERIVPLVKFDELADVTRHISKLLNQRYVHH